MRTGDFVVIYWFHFERLETSDLVVQSDYYVTPYMHSVRTAKHDGVTRRIAVLRCKNKIRLGNNPKMRAISMAINKDVKGKWI